VERADEDIAREIRRFVGDLHGLAVAGGLDRGTRAKTTVPRWYALKLPVNGGDCAGLGPTLVRNSCHGSPGRPGRRV
jgi:hypothetical protein